ncbi:MAG: S8 family serine peptidase [Acidobacteriota bacterium]
MFHLTTPLVRLALVAVLLAQPAAANKSRQQCVVPSSLNCDYWLVVPEGKPDRAWIRELAVRAGENGAILGELRSGAFLVRAADDAHPRLSRIPGLASLTEVDGATKLSPELRYLVDSDTSGEWQALSATLHQGEDPETVGVALADSLNGDAVIVSVAAPRGPRGRSDGAELLIQARTQSLDRTLSLLSEAEPVSMVSAWQAPELQSHPGIAWHQTGIEMSGLTMDPVHDYGNTAALFANGILGVGQVIGILDRGYDATDGCQFRYGPNAADERSPFQVIAPDAAPTLDLDKKIIASVRPLPLDPGCTYDGVNYHLNGDLETNPHPLHGTNSASVAAGDDHWILSGMAGLSLEDPIDIESTREISTGGTFENVIDHHDLADGMAPGAQLFLQDALPERTQLETWGLEDPPLLSEDQLPCRYDYSDIITQAYEAHAQLRVHNNSWGTNLNLLPDPMTPPHYHRNSEVFDRASWQLRDLVFTRSAGNTSVLLREAQSKSSIVVGASFQPIAPTIGESMFGWTMDPGLQHRIKPDLIGQMPLSRKGMSCPPVQGSEWHGGTSTTAPAIAGVTTLAREYFVEGYYPGGSRDSSPGFSPTNALVKATLINSTRNLTGTLTGDETTSSADRPTHGQGWGRPVLDDTLYFAGDEAVLGGQRANFLVLNDVPNGVRTTNLKDGRHELVDQYHPAIAEGEIHEYKVHVNNTHQFHVTLSWSDPPPVLLPGEDSITANPLRNDLDLEIISPHGIVYRPNPGMNVLDSDRLWNGGYSIPGTANCPTVCCRSSTIPEAKVPQFSGPYFCDFAGRDRWNTTENIFIDFTPDLLPRGVWTIRVIGYDFLMGMADPDPMVYPAWPDLVEGDEGCYTDELGNPISEPHDCIVEEFQGYALVVSGDVSSANPDPRFLQANYTCGEQAIIEVRDSDRDDDTLDVLVQSLDPSEACRDAMGVPVPARQVTLHRVLYPNGTDSPVYRSVAADLELQDCAQSAFGAYPVQDDSLLLVSYQDESDQWRNATTRFSCRNVKLQSATGSGITPGSTGLLNVLVNSMGTVPVGVLAGEIHPMLTDGGFPSSIPVTFTNFGGTHFGVVSISIPAGFDCTAHPELRFRAELWEVDGTGTPIDGFRDRVWFGVDCDP